MGDRASLTDAESVAAAFDQYHQTALHAWSRGETTDQQAAWLAAFAAHDLFRFGSEDDRVAWEEASLACQALESELPQTRRVLAAASGTPIDRPVSVRGNPHALGNLVPRQFLTALRTRDPRPDTDRLDLAETMLRDGRHFVARVMANRLWHHLMGRGIVASVDNFGVLGQEPTHPDLLDYLALRLIEQDWSIKRLIREVVLSHTYQQSSAPRTGRTH